MQPLQLLSGVQYSEPGRILGRKFQITLSNFLMKSQVLLLESILPALLGGKNEEGHPLFARHVIPGVDHNFAMPGNAEKLSVVLNAWLVQSNMPWVVSPRARDVEHEQ